MLVWVSRGPATAAEKLLPLGPGEVHILGPSLFCSGSRLILSWVLELLNVPASCMLQMAQNYFESFSEPKSLLLLLAIALLLFQSLPLYTQTFISTF